MPVPTLSDDVLEGLEYFTGVIQVPPDTTTNYRVTASSPDTAMVNIIDATSEYHLCNLAKLCTYTYIVYIDNAQAYIAACLPTTLAVGVLLLANERCAGSVTIAAT